MDKKIKCYKGTDKNIKCLGYQFEVGKEHKEDRTKICKYGFHACENPLDVFKYYPPADSRYFEVDLDATDERHDDSKRVGTSIKLTKEIGLHGLIKAGVEYIKSNVNCDTAKEFNTGDNSASTNTGNWSASTNTGNYSASTNTGNYSASTNTGYQSASTNTGDNSTSTNTGNNSASTAEGKQSVAMVCGYKGKARGNKGCVLFLIERNNGMEIVAHTSLMVDGKRYKEMVFYMLKNGEIVEVM